LPACKVCRARHRTNPACAAYKEALAKNQAPIDEALVVGDSFSEQSGYIETKLLLRSEPDVTAILALSNLNALGCIRALAEEKRNIPDDISIVSFDDPPYAAYLATPMTSIAHLIPKWEMLRSNCYLTRYNQPADNPVAAF